MSESGSSRWVKVSAASAQKHPLYGVGGFLYFWIFVITANLIADIFFIFIYNYEYQSNILILIEIFICSYLIYKIFKKNTEIRHIVVFYAAVSFIHLIYILIYVTGLGIAGYDIKTHSIAGIVLGLTIRNILIMVYFSNSKRVRITYLGEVRYNDALAVDGRSADGGGMEATR